MKVFAVYQKGEAALVPFWAQSWQDKGFHTRLLSPRDLAFKPVSKLVRGGILVDVRTINFHHRRGRKFKRVSFGKRGWKTAAVVHFPPGSTEDTLLTCGRKL